MVWDFFNNVIANPYDGTPLVNNVAVDEFGNVATANQRGAGSDRTDHPA